jgi:prepilin-type N-terminal cleavage/methylation domain-containing protein
MNQNETGFTLIEVLVVVLIVGILSAIVGPTWTGLLTKQKLGMGTEQVYLKIKEAQSKAQQENRAYRVSFQNNTTNGMPQIAINPLISINGVPPATSNRWENVGTKSNDLAFNTTTLTSEGNTLIINYDGTINNENSPITVGESINLRIPNQDTANQQCVVIRTLLGTLEKTSGKNCDTTLDQK